MASVVVLVRTELARLAIGLLGSCCVAEIEKYELLVEERLGRQMDGNIQHQDRGPGRNCCLVDNLHSRQKDWEKVCEGDVLMLEYVDGLEGWRSRQDMVGSRDIR